MSARQIGVLNKAHFNEFNILFHIAQKMFFLEIQDSIFEI